jgi:hypothetical protein
MYSETWALWYSTAPALTGVVDRASYLPSISTSALRQRNLDSGSGEIELGISSSIVLCIEENATIE